MAAPIVTLLWSADRQACGRHFLRLSADDRRLRFGLSLSDSAVRDYVARMNFEEEAVFGVFEENLQLDGVAHLVRRGDSSELGISVLSAARGCGLGNALLARSHTHARNWGVEVLRLQCLTDNSPMMHIALKQGMTIERQMGEASAFRRLVPADSISREEAAIDQRMALFDNFRKIHQVTRTRVAQIAEAGS